MKHTDLYKKPVIEFIDKHIECVIMEISTNDQKKEISSLKDYLCMLFPHDMHYLVNNSPEPNQKNGESKANIWEIQEKHLLHYYLLSKVTNNGLFRNSEMKYLIVKENIDNSSLFRAD